MPTARRSRTIAAPADELWALVRDPHHLPRWWPRVTRVEDVIGGAFTEVMATSKGKLVRADFDIVHSDEQARSLTWEQRVEGTPFARLLKSARTEVRLEPHAGDSSDSGDMGAHGAEPAAGGASRVGGAKRAGGLKHAGDTAPGTQVTIEVRQSLAGFFPRFGSFMVRRAAAATIDEALDGLERISG